MKTIGWEALALAKLIKEQDKTLLIDLNESLFSNHTKNLFKSILKHFSDTHQIPSFPVLEAIVNDKAPKAIRPVVLGHIEAMKKLEISDINTNEIISGLRDKLLLSTIDNNIKSLTEKAMTKDTASVRAIFNTMVEQLNLSEVKPTDFSEAMDAPDMSKIITSGIDGLDDIITGVAGLTIIAGSSGGGKSLLMLQAAANQFLAGHSVLFVSLELSPQVLGMRLKSYLTGIPFNKIIKGELSEEEKKIVSDTMKGFFDRPNKFRIIYDPLDSEELLTLIHTEKSLYDIDICYIDYMNLVSAPKHSSGGWQALTDLARDLHRISMRIGVISVSAAQVDLEKAPKNGEYPIIRTRGSKELEYSATLMMYVHTPEKAEGSEMAESEPAVLYILKNRNAPRAQILLDKKFQFMKFEFVMEL
jgi:replicative DNA helicase